MQRCTTSSRGLRRIFTSTTNCRTNRAVVSCSKFARAENVMPSSARPSFCCRLFTTQTNSPNQTANQTQIKTVAPEVLAQQRKIYDELLVRMGLHDLNGWYRITDDDIFRREEAWEVLQYYGNLVFTLKALYPEHKWEPWKFTRIPDGWWDNMQHQREYFDWLLHHLKLKDFNAWYDVSYKDVRRQPGGYVLFSHYQDNIKKALMTIYPEHPWHEPRFDESPQAYWDRLAGSPADSQIRSYMEHIAQQLDVGKAEDWYRVSRTQLRKVGASHVIKKYGGIVALLKRIYPKFKWSESKFVTAGKKSTQRALKLCLEELFPEMEIIEEYRPSSLSFVRSKSDVELDIYIPQIRLAFEYQGAQHYADVFTYGQRIQGRERDPEKTAACLKEGITLISVPYWWDNEKDSLANTIRQVRADVLPGPFGDGQAIPEHPPTSSSRE